MVRGLSLLTALAWVGSLSAAAPAGPLTTLRQVRELTPAQADEQLQVQVQVEGLLTFVDPARFMCFLQDDTAGIYLQLEKTNQFQPGQRVRLTGTAHPGRFTPFLRVSELSVLGSAPLPAAPTVEFSAFKAGFLEGERVALSGRVIALKPEGDRLRLKLARGGELVVVWVGSPATVDPLRLRQAQVRISGICSGVFNDRNEIIDFHLHATDGAAIELLTVVPPAAEPVSARPIRELESGWREGGPVEVRCRGRVTLHWPGQFLFIQDGSGALELRTEEAPVLHAGDEVEAAGLRQVANRRLVLAECRVQKLAPGPRPPSRRADFEWIHSRHSHGELVEVEAEVAELIGRAPPEPEPGGTTHTPAPFILLRQRDWLVRAEFPPGLVANATAFVQPGSRLRVTGVLAARPAAAGEPLAYRLLVDSPAAVTVLRQPSWWTLRRAVLAVGGSGLAIISGLGWFIGLNQGRRRKEEAKIQRQREKAAHYREALLRLTQLVQTTTEEASLRQVTELVSRALGGTRVSVWRLVEHDTRLLCLDLYDGAQHQAGEILVVADFPAYCAALRACRIIAADDARTDPRTVEFGADYLVAQDIRSLLDVPLRFHGQPAGVLCIEQTGVARTWDEVEQDFAGAVADQLTILREEGERLRAERALREAHSELELRVLLRTTQLAEARDRAEAADRLKSAFLATMSHELRTPLNSIIGFTGILLQGLVGPLTDEQKKQLGMVQNSARHLLSLINDVLDISKIEAGQVEVAPAPFDVREAVGRALELVRPLAVRKGLTLTAHLEPAVGPLVSDRRRVEQILINLLNNALKFTERGEVRLGGEVAGNRLVLHVTDTGIGIRAEDCARLFKPFQQLDTGLARHHEGTGLGLAICAGLAKLLRGTIEVRSEFGRGSTFALSLPLDSPKSHENGPDHRG